MLFDTPTTAEKFWLRTAPHNAVRHPAVYRARFFFFFFSQVDGLDQLWEERSVKAVDRNKFTKLEQIKDVLPAVRFTSRNSLCCTSDFNITLWNNFGTHIFPRRLTFSWWGWYGLCPRHKSTELAHSFFYSVLVSVSVFMALSIVFHSINSPENSPLSHSVLLFLLCVLPCLFLPFQSIHLHFFPKPLPNVSCVGLQNKIGHPAGCRFPCWVPAAYK